VLGYDVAPQGGRLVINEPEAQRVREIFAICEQAGTLAEGLRQVNARALTSKEWRSRGGAPHAGKAFSKSLLSRLLTNVLYKGSISHKGTIYPGEHEAIVEHSLWEKVNRKLVLNGASQIGIKHLRQQALLLNLARCGQCGAELIPTFTRKAGKRHSYYVCMEARRRQGCRQRPVAMEDLESSLKRRLEEVLGPQPSAVMIQQALERVMYSSKTCEVAVILRDGARFEFGLAIPNRAGVRRTKAAKSGRIPRITKLMVLAIKMEGLVREGKVTCHKTLAAVGHISKPRMSQIMNLTNLAPEIQETLLFLPRTLAGQDPITERRMRPIVQAVDWDSQRKLFSARMSR
jgi:hypothetical protein